MAEFHSVCTQSLIYHDSVSKRLHLNLLLFLRLICLSKNIIISICPFQEIPHGIANNLLPVPKKTTKRKYSICYSFSRSVSIMISSIFPRVFLFHIDNLSTFYCCCRPKSPILYDPCFFNYSHITTPQLFTRTESCFEFKFIFVGKGCSDYCCVEFFKSFKCLIFSPL